MSENPGIKPAAGPVGDSKKEVKRANRAGRSSLFRYYIHDGIAACRLQLLGDLSEADLFDLNGCWRTVKTTLGERQLLLDLHGLRSVDEAGKQWLASVAQDGGTCSPESFLRDLVAGKHMGEASVCAPQRAGWFGRIVGLFRGFVVQQPVK